MLCLDRAVCVDIFGPVVLVQNLISSAKELSSAGEERQMALLASDAAVCGSVDSSFGWPAIVIPTVYLSISHVSRAPFYMTYAAPTFFWGRL